MLNFLTRKAVTFETRPFLGQRVRATGITKKDECLEGRGGRGRETTGYRGTRSVPSRLGGGVAIPAA